MYTSNDLFSRCLSGTTAAIHTFSVPDGGLRFSNLLNCTFFRGEIQVHRKETKILKNAARFHIRPACPEAGVSSCDESASPRQEKTSCTFLLGGLCDTMLAAVPVSAASFPKTHATNGDTMNQKELNEIRRRFKLDKTHSARSTAAMSTATRRSSPAWTPPWASCPRRSRRCTWDF